MTKPPRIRSTYAIVDVENGRKALAKHLREQGPMPVVIHAVLTEPYGHDDGVSIEFNATVTKIEVGRG